MPEFTVAARITSDGTAVIEADDQAHAERLAENLTPGQVTIDDSTVEVMDVRPKEG